MAERTCVITGATSGIGRAAAFALAREGLRLALVARNREKAEATAREIARATPGAAVDVFVADLAVQAQIRRVAGELSARLPRIDVLLNNAGIVNLRREETPDGIEATFAVNHLAYFLLTELLLDRLRASAPARVVSVASDAYRFGKLDLDDLEYRRRAYKPMQVYGSSKLLNVLWNAELARRLEGSGVTANCLHPGGVNTGLGDNNAGVLRVLGKAVKRFMRSPEKGADTAVWLATAPEVAGVSGGYFGDRKPRRPSPAASDPAAARRLWEISERLCARSV
jgi:NAD(P)-dependent dehydrogenase (short-subunit alcohol dehydrogenase family)